MIPSLVTALGLPLAARPNEMPDNAARGANAAVATVHPLATDAAMKVFRHGGNAIDAAVAAGLTLSVVDAYNSGIGGGCFLLIRQADGSIHAIDGRETAPAAAHPDMYLRDGLPQPLLSQTGPLAVAVPGALSAYALAVEKFGRKPLAELLQPAIRHAAEGFPLNREFAEQIRAQAEELRQFEGARALFFDEADRPLEEGSIFRQTDLAKTLRAIAENGVDWFYRGEFAEIVSAWMEANGGNVTKADFAGYRALGREPLRSGYRGYEVIGFPPPSSGGVHVAQILNILQNVDPLKLREDPLDQIHFAAEAIKLAFADRSHWLGDPDFAMVPRGLTDPAYARQLAERIDPDGVIEVRHHSLPPGWENDHFSRHTTHFSTADAEGNWVAVTATINTAFGSKVVVPGTGVLLNNEMDDFSIHPGVPNHFGLIGSDANKVEAGKRPLSSMSPTLLLRDGEPFASLGAAGGPTIISQTVLNIMSLVDLGLSPAEALARPRFHHQWLPDKLRMEEGWEAEIASALRERGHNVEMTPKIGVSQAVARVQHGLLEAAHDPRVQGKAAAW